MSPQIEALIARRFAAPEYATFFEVSNSTGSMRRRRADAIALGIWPSRGFDLHGFEIKTDRRDWLREKKDPEKAEAISKFCDFWWLVTSDDNVCPIDELPMTWGLLVHRSGKLFTAKQAPKREAEPITRGFMAAMLRKVSETTVPKSMMQAEVERLAAEHAKWAEESKGLAARHDAQELQSLRDRVEAFERVSGVKIDRWSHGDVGAAVRALLRLKDGHANPLARAADAARSFVRDFDAVEAAAKGGA